MNEGEGDGASERFVAEARAYCSFVRSAAGLSLAERLLTARRRLLALYTAALPLVLPDVSDEGVDAPDHSPRPADWPGFDKYEMYWQFFDPYEPEAVGGSLSDDMLGCYFDIEPGLALWDAGRRREALWEWRCNFDIHWGNHAINALRALHHACMYLTA